MTYPSLADFFDYEIAALIVQTMRKHSINWEAGYINGYFSFVSWFRHLRWPDNFFYYLARFGAEIYIGLSVLPYHLILLERSIRANLYLIDYLYRYIVHV